MSDQTPRQRTAELLEANRPDDPLGRTIDLFLIGLILANVAVIMLETLPGLPLGEQRFFWYFEVFSVAVFTVEYFARLWSCVDRPRAKSRHPVVGRLRWMLSPLGLIDLLAILPFYLYLFLPESAESLLMLRIFRGLRLLRLFKLTRYSPALAVMVTVIRRESATLLVAGFFLLVILVVTSWGVYLLEKDQQPEAFSSIPDAMWWAIVSLTTVGYGDVVPVTAGGKILAGLVALLGIGVVALPAGILASGFSQVVRERGQTYRRAIRIAVSDGRITEAEAEVLEALRERLGISSEEAQKTLEDVKAHALEADVCPHCGKKLTPPETEAESGPS